MDTPTNPWQPGNDPGTPSDTAPVRTRRPLKGLALVAAGAIGATALTGVAFAATSTPSPSNPSSGSNAPANPEDGGPGMMGGDHDGDGPGGFGGPDGRRGHHGDGGPMGMFGGPGGGKGIGGRVLHGEAVVTNKDGSNVTVRVQNGDITAASATEITVKSSDGFEQTWPLTADTKVHRNKADATAADLVVGDRVMVIGEVNGDTVTTLRVGALDAEQAKARDAEREQRQQEREQNGQQSTPSPSATS